MKYTLNLTVEYPKELKTGLLSEEEIYKALANHAMEHVSQLSKAIREELFSRFPSLEKGLISVNMFHDAIDEMVKNIFDAVNDYKIKNLNLDSIEINVVVMDVGNKLQIKIKDNGQGFENVGKSVEIPLSQFLSARGKGVSKKQEAKRELNKKYILGGQGIGLQRMLDEVKPIDSITIKNRKSSGASIRLTFNIKPDPTEPLDKPSKVPARFSKGSNDSFFKDPSSKQEMSDSEDAEKALNAWLDEGSDSEEDPKKTLNDWLDEGSDNETLKKGNKHK